MKEEISRKKNITLESNEKKTTLGIVGNYHWKNLQVL